MTYLPWSLGITLIHLNTLLHAASYRLAISAHGISAGFTASPSPLELPPQLASAQNELVQLVNTIVSTYSSSPVDSQKYQVKSWTLSPLLTQRSKAMTIIRFILFCRATRCIFFEETIEQPTLTQPLPHHRPIVLKIRTVVTPQLVRRLFQRPELRLHVTILRLCGIIGRGNDLHLLTTSP